MISKYKPVGWRNESHRHYLASKGIKSKTDWRYFDAKTQEKSQEMFEKKKMLTRALDDTLAFTPIQRNHPVAEKAQQRMQDEFKKKVQKKIDSGDIETVEDIERANKEQMAATEFAIRDFLNPETSDAERDRIVDELFGDEDL